MILALVFYWFAFIVCGVAGKLLFVGGLSQVGTDLMAAGILFFLSAVCLFGWMGSLVYGIKTFLQVIQS